MGILIHFVVAVKSLKSELLPDLSVAVESRTVADITRRATSVSRRY
jgi:hypothetical protein